MNPHLKQLWAAMRLPENFKKSYKFFCRGLDIRVPQHVGMQGERHKGRNVRVPQPGECGAGHISAIGGWDDIPAQVWCILLFSISSREMQTAADGIV